MNQISCTLKRKTYVEFHCQLASPDTPIMVETRDIKMLEIPKAAYAFHLFDILEGQTKIDGLKMDVTTPRFNVSPLHYTKGTVYRTWEHMNKSPVSHAGRVKSRQMKEAGLPMKPMIVVLPGQWINVADEDIFLESVVQFKIPTKTNRSRFNPWQLRLFDS